MKDTFNSSFQKFQELKSCILIDDTNQLTLNSTIIVPAQFVTSEIVNKVLHITGAILFVVLSKKRAGQFLLNPSLRPQKSHGSKFIEPYLNILTSVEAREGVSTGISASDRARTIATLGSPTPNPREIIQPGHIFPIIAKEGGILVKNALPEATIDLCTIAGFNDAALYVDILNNSGERCNLNEIDEIALKHSLPCIYLSDLIKFRMLNESLVKVVTKSKLPTAFGGEMDTYIFESTYFKGEHLALVKGNVQDPLVPVMTRVQSESTFTDVFGSGIKSSRLNIDLSLKEIGANKNGIFLYLRRSSGGQVREYIQNYKNKADEVQKNNSSVFLKEYGIGAQILRALGVSRINLLTASPNITQEIVSGLKYYGIEIVNQKMLIPN